MAPTRCAPDPMPIFGTSGSRTSPPEVGKLAGRLAITNPEWTAWMQFSSAKNPGEVALGYGYRGKSDDLPDEMVDVLCIIFGSKGRKFAVARQGDGTLFAAGFFNQQGELAWKALQAPASAAAQMPPAVLSELNAYLQLTEYQVNNRRNKLRKRALVAREPGASLSARSYQKRLHGSGEQEEAPMEVMAFPEQEVPAPQPRKPAASGARRDIPVSTRRVGRAGRQPEQKAGAAGGACRRSAAVGRRSSIGQPTTSTKAGRAASAVRGGAGGGAAAGGGDGEWGAAMGCAAHSPGRRHYSRRALGGGMRSHRAEHDGEACTRRRRAIHHHVSLPSY